MEAYPPMRTARVIQKNFLALPALTIRILNAMEGVLVTGGTELSQPQVATALNKSSTPRLWRPQS
jgi:hypothetical protein